MEHLKGGVGVELVPDIEKNVHIVWLGSKLKQKHVDRIGLWIDINPQYQHTVWVERAYESEINEQLSGKNVRVRLVTELDVTENFSTLIKNLSKKETAATCPNYAACCDGYRFKILHDFGGWYVDTDITPIDLSLIKINPQFNFYFNGGRTDDLVTDLSPSVIAASSKNLLLVNALIILEEMGRLLTEVDYNAIRSRQASLRYLSTLESTGVVLRLALVSLKHNNLPLIEMFNEDEGKINHLDVFDSIANRFATAMEQTWILSNVQPIKDKPGLYAFEALTGITLDNDYMMGLTADSYAKFPELYSLYKIQKLALDKAASGPKMKLTEREPTTVGISPNSFFYRSADEEKNTDSLLGEIGGGQNTYLINNK
ncbi:MAG: glycosyltransferase [Legionella sp.]|jgi:hypothetical protein